MFTQLFQSPLNHILAGVCVILAAISHWRGMRQFVWGLRNPDHPKQSLKVVRGIRGWIVGTALLLIGGGLEFDATWAVLFGLVFVAEELFETGIMIFALKRGEKSESS
ncbi:MAG: hypothetical protein ACE5GA_01700 [Candidatus Zixiibacteriota bacterium]